MSLFPIPKGAIDLITKIQRKFLWCEDNERKPFPLISWNVMELPKYFGGLGIGNMLNRNILLLFKWWWRFLTEPHALWRKVILHKYGYFPPFSLNDITIPSTGDPWKDICSSILQKNHVKKFVLSCVRKGVGDGSSTLFWHDLWVGDSTLKALFPRLFLLAHNPNSTVATMGFWDGLKWTWTIIWRRDMRSRDLADLDSLMGIINQVALDPKSHDIFVWPPHKSGLFSVKSLSSELDKCSPHVPEANLKKIWKGLVPRRIELFVWFALLGKINSRAKLTKIGIIPPDEASCVFCDWHLETESHLFLHCLFASQLWSWWLEIWNLSWCFPHNLRDCFFQWEYRNANPFFKKVWMVAFFIILWSIWKERNARIFKTTSCNTSQFKDLILLRLSWWIKGWGDEFPYSSNEVIHHPQCLKWNSMPCRPHPHLLSSDSSDWEPPPPLWPKVERGCKLRS